MIMEIFKIVLIFIYIYFAFSGVEIVEASNKSQSSNVNISELDSQSLVEDQLTMQIYAFIDHFKQPNPIGIPLSIPDPLIIPMMKPDMKAIRMVMTNIHVYGVSKFQLESASIELDEEMKGSCQLKFDTIVMVGNYTLSTIGTTKGPFKIVINDIVVYGTASLAVERDGKLRAQDIESDIKISKMDVKMDNLGWLAGTVQNFINAADNRFFETIKPYVLRDSKAMIKKTIDEKIDENLSEYGTLPNSISAVDYAIAEARKNVKESFDPFKINDYETTGMVGYRIHDIVISGLSSFYRVGDIKVKIENGNAIVNIDIGTKELNGKAFWQVSMMKGMITRGGKFQFAIQHIKTSVQLCQPVDLSKRLKIEDLQIELGNIQVSSSGLGTLDYLVEFFVNTIPNIIRYQVMDAIEKPIMHRIQQFTDQIDAEQLIKEKVKEYATNGTINFDFNKKYSYEKFHLEL